MQTQESLSIEQQLKSKASRINLMKKSIAKVEKLIKKRGGDHKLEEKLAKKQHILANLEEDVHRLSKQEQEMKEKEQKEKEQKLKEQEKESKKPAASEDSEESDGESSDEEQIEKEVK